MFRCMAMKEKDMDAGNAYQVGVIANLSFLLPYVW